MSQIRKRNKKALQSQAEQNGASSSIGPSFFYEDEVFRVTKNGDVEFGMVTENWDMYSSDEDEEDEEFDSSDKVPHGSVAVTWLPKSKDEVLAETKVKLSDRSLMPGDVVRRLIAGKDTQRGYCRSVRVSADVQIVGTKKVILGVPATTLLPVQKLQSEIAVYMDSWIGVVRDAKYRIALRFGDGSTCQTDSDVLMDNFEEVRNNTDYHESELFYPGQKLRGRLKHLKDADYSHITNELKKTKDKKTVHLVVTDVQPLSLNVQWQWQTPGTLPETTTSNNDLKPPSEILTGEDIKRVQCLNLFESCTVQLCDISYYTPTPKDVLVNKSEWKKNVLGIITLKNDKKLSIGSEEVATNFIKEEEDEEAFLSDENVVEAKNNIAENDKQASKISNAKKLLPKVCTRSLKKKKLKKAQQKSKSTKVETHGLTVVETVHTQSLVDVVWQDGTYEEAMRSVDLYPIHHLDDHEFFPGDFVVNAESNDFKTYGVIQKMDHCGRVALVRWFETYSFNGEQKPKQLEEMEMSVYDIKDHPDFRFRPGTIVIRVANMQDQQCPAGQILDNYPDGQVRVWWANGAITFCWPQDLFRLGEYDSDDEMWEGEENGENDGAAKAAQTDTDDGLEEDGGANSDSSWETETEDDQNIPEPEPSANRYQNIGQLIERIQKTLVNTREAIVASSSVSINEEGIVGTAGGSTESVSTPVAKVKLGNFDERGLTKKLLLIYKDCQYLDKIMGTKFFDIEDLKKWRNSNQDCSAKSRKIVDQISRLFDVPKTPSGGSDKNVPALDEGPPQESVQQKDATPPNKAESDTNFPDQGMILYELCSVILKKLVDAHSAYEKQFGNFKQENAAQAHSDEDTKRLEALVERIATEIGAFDKAHEDSNEPEEKFEDAVETIEELVTPAITGIEFDSNSTNFSVVEKVPDTHRYRLTSLLPQNQRQFVKCVQREVSLLRESLPDGIFVKGFEDRMDLYSVMIEGPAKTPYEDGLFMFDIQLPPAYPTVPPLVHYIAFCTDRLNPNLYEEGKVCVSLLGTWNGKGTEVWGASSSLLQLLVSIQGLILGPEPYYNEAGYEKQKGTQQGAENSRMYNENVLIKLVQSMSRMVVSPATAWEKESTQYIKNHGPKMVDRYKAWLELNLNANLGVVDNVELPPFPLLPVSKGFQITLTKSISSFAKVLNSIQ